MDNCTERNAYHNEHLPVVLPVCPLPETACTYRLCYRQHTATGDVHTVDRSAAFTEVCRSFISVICECIDGFESSRYMCAV